MYLIKVIILYFFIKVTLHPCLWIVKAFPYSKKTCAVMLLNWMLQKPCNYDVLRMEKKKKEQSLNAQLSLGARALSRIRWIIVGVRQRRRQIIIPSDMVVSLPNEGGFLTAILSGDKL